MEIEKTNYISEIKEILSSARKNVQYAINVSMVYAYYEMGRIIVEQEQHGKNRAEYGKKIIRTLSRELTKDFGKGFSIQSLSYIRQFYIVYSNNEIVHTLRGKSSNVVVIEKNQQKIQTPFGKSNNNVVKDFNDQITNFPLTRDGQRFCLGWTMYRVLIRIKNQKERRFYEIEAYNNKWSTRELERQINSALYERLSLSRNKEEILELSRVGQIVEKLKDMFKKIAVLEFLNLPVEDVYTEKKFEERIIEHLQEFILELGKGFIFVGRQVRLLINGKEYRPDLVFYKISLRCHVVVDLKIGKLDHGDIGQMLLYTGYYDEHIKMKNENPTVGLILCKDNDEIVVHYTLDKIPNPIFVSEYIAVLPSKEDLERIIADEK